MTGRMVKDTTAYPPHRCSPPTQPEGYNSWGPVGSMVAHGVGSIWECDCGVRWVVIEVEHPKVWPFPAYTEKAWHRTEELETSE